MINLFRQIIKFIKNLFINPDFSGRVNVLDVAIYLVQISLKKEKFLNINQLIQMLFIIQKSYLENKNFALFKEDFTLDNKGRLLLKDVCGYFAGFGFMDLWIPYSENKLSKDYRDDLDMLFDLFVDRIKSGEFKKQIEFALKDFNSDSQLFKRWILYNVKI